MVNEIIAKEKEIGEISCYCRLEKKSFNSWIYGGFLKPVDSDCENCGGSGILPDFEDNGGSVVILQETSRFRSEIKV